MIDLRPPLAFAQRHVAGAVNVQFNRADLADRAEMVLPEGLPVVLYADTDATAAAAETILEAAFDVRGRLEGGLATWEAAGREVAELPVVTADEVHDSPSLGIIDAREGFEYRYGHIEGALLLSSSEAWDRAEEIPLGEKFAVVCGDQVRSALVASILLRRDRDVWLMTGGMADWLARGYPVEKTAKAG